MACPWCSLAWLCAEHDKPATRDGAAKLNADLQAGRVKLPKDDWQREYLGTFAPPSSPSLDWAKAVQAERDKMRRETARHYGIAIMADPRCPPDKALIVAQGSGVPTVVAVDVAKGVVTVAKVDPLDVRIEGVTLRYLLQIDEERRREGHPNYRTAWARLSGAQRAAVSAHWSAELRAKVEATRKADLERERTRVVVDCEDW